MSEANGPAMAQRLSPNCSARARGIEPDMVLLHYTAMASADLAADWLCDPKSSVSCHYLVDEDGAIVAIVPEDARAWHAGAASWAGVEDINSCSIGIEIQNPGPQAGYPDFPTKQMAALEELCADIMLRHAIAPERVLAHSDVAPTRKIDPGEKFDWAWLANKGIGHWVEPASVTEGDVLGPGSEGQAVETCQGALRAYGYFIPATGVYDALTEQVVKAFQRHFRQARVDGLFDASTRVTLERLSAALTGEGV